MAATIKLVTYSGQTVTPKDDAIIYDTSVAQNGVFYGCDVTASGNTLYVAGGYGMVKGRFFEIENSSIPVTLASGDTLLGRLYIHLDLSNSAAPIQLLTETGATLSSLTQEDDANYTDGVYDVEMATFNVTTTAITNLTEKFDTIRDRAYLQQQITALNSKTYIKVKDQSYSATVAGGGNNATVNYSFDMLSTHARAAVILHSVSGTGSGSVSITLHGTASSGEVHIYNPRSAQATVNFTLREIYVLNSAYENIT